MGPHLDVYFSLQKLNKKTRLSEENISERQDSGIHRDSILYPEQGKKAESN